VMDGIPVALPALLHAQKVQGKAAAVGFDWEDADGAWPKVDEEMAETRQAVATGGDVEEELGDLLFACVNVARHLGVDAEGALRRATAKFGVRFRGVERLAAERGISLGGAGLATLDALWDEVKAGVPPVA
jgi:MazG family protein